MRAFVAIVLPPGESRAPSTPEHVTVRFLGEIGSERVAEVEFALRRAVSELAPFELVLSGVGAFPSNRHPKVLWVGASEGRGRLEELAARVERELTSVGFPAADHPFVPHLTLFRVRSAEDRSRARQVLEGGPTPPPIRFVVRGIELKESELRAGGALHRTVSRFDLGPGKGPVA